MSILFAATYPEKVSSLILGSAFARWFPAPDYPCGPGAEVVYAAMHDDRNRSLGPGRDYRLVSAKPRELHSNTTSARSIRAHGDQPERFPADAPDDQRNRRSGRAARHPRPTLVIQRLGDRINPPFYGRYIATHIPGARYFEQPGDHVLRFAEGEELVDLFAEIEEFLATTPPSTQPPRVLTTILIAQPVRDVTTSEHVRAHRGRLRTSTADSILATFDAPGQAIRCAAAIRADAAAHGIQSRAGIHTGEVSLEGEGINGISVEIAKRISARASASEILVSRTVKDLVVGSGIAFAHRGSYPMTAPDDRWPLFAVTAA